MPVDRVHIQVFQHQVADLGQACLGVAHRGCVVAVDGAEVALAVDEHIAQAEILGHAHHGIVHGRIAMGVVLTQHFTDDTGALFVGLVVCKTQIAVHRIENAAMDRLQAVAHVGQGPGDDYAHCVVEVGVLHGMGDVNRHDGADCGVTGRVSVCGAHRKAFYCNG